VSESKDKGKKMLDPAAVKRTATSREGHWAEVLSPYEKGRGRRTTNFREGPREGGESGDRVTRTKPSADLLQKRKG